MEHEENIVRLAKPKKKGLLALVFSRLFLIVLLMAGHIGGTMGMLVAIPAYTVVRVIAIRFFYNFKPIKRLVPDLQEEDKIIENID